MKASPAPKKLPKSLLIFGACVIGVGLSLFAVNYWHAQKCADLTHSPDQTEELIAVLSRRLLESESQVMKNENLLNKIIHSMEANLLKLEQTQYETIAKQSHDEAIKIALYLESHPAPPMPEFPMDNIDTEKLADIIDDVFSRSGLDGEEYKLDFFNEEKSEEIKDNPEDNLSDAEAQKACLEYKSNYNVVVGESWGTLPENLQSRWFALACDYHLDENFGKDDDKEYNKEA